ncbi:hypothetical protein CVT24_005303 [Panaeolus cyanescens]|uniref:Aminoglycoside phosphotransferase domain-containing protein n=1 Tax=Panaeolus cyanescens TaxID=181874 RepID=A0A409Y9I9_9AGAR|nr:hypothetical protein CVT24_005303 [Panaeolus cyanescens]
MSSVSLFIVPSTAESQSASVDVGQKDADAERILGPTAADIVASTGQKPNEGKRDWDLSVEADVARYLASTPFACTSIKALSGGTANFVYRLTLDQPYKGHKALVLKHGKGFVKNSPEFALDLARQKFEVEALRHVFAWLPSDWLVRVPEVHLFDENENVIIMDDTGKDSMNLKDYLQKGMASTETARIIGTELGRFLGALHSWGKSNVDIQKAVSGNVQGKAIKAMYYYGGLKPTLDGSAKVPFLSDPTLDVSPEDMQVVEQISAETMQAIQEANGAFVMGDFWPGNVMINVEAGQVKHIMVIDWELSKEGILGIDIGQFAAELHLLRQCNPETSKETATVALDSFLAGYKQERQPTSEDARRAICHLGAHMIILGARVAWGPKEISRRVVLEGVRILVDGSKTSELDKTLIGGLI